MGTGWKQLRRFERPVRLCAAVCVLSITVALVWQQAGVGDFRPSLADQLTGAACRGDPVGLRAVLDASPRPRDRQVTADDLGLALHLAAALGHIDVVDELLRRGVDPDSPSRNGVTTLMGIVNGNEGAEIAHLLIGAGADIDAADSSGRTTLMDAVAAGRTDLVRVLLDAGADVNVIDRRGRTAMTEANGSADPELLTLLARAKAIRRASGTRQKILENQPHPRAKWPWVRRIPKGDGKLVLRRPI